MIKIKYSLNLKATKKNRNVKQKKIINNKKNNNNEKENVAVISSSYILPDAIFDCDVLL